MRLLSVLVMAIVAPISCAYSNNVIHKHDGMNRLGFSGLRLDERLQEQHDTSSINIGTIRPKLRKNKSPGACYKAM